MTSLRGLAAVAFSGCIVACGSTSLGSPSESTGPADAGSSAPVDAGAASGGSADAGDGGPSGSSADAGTQGSGGSGDAGAPDSGTGGGSTGGGAGGGSGGSDAGTASDAGMPTDGGSASNDCDGLRFAADPGTASASHFIFVRDSTVRDGCSRGATTGTGTLALEMLAEESTLDFVSPAGALLSTNQVVSPKSFFGENDLFFDNENPSTEFVLHVWSDDGKEKAPTPFRFPDVQEDPTGGAVAMDRSHGCLLKSLDHSLAVRWTAPCPAPSEVAMAVDRAGATLYSYDGSQTFGQNSIAAFWVDSEGHEGQPFALVGPQAKFNLGEHVVASQRVGSGLFIQIDGDWVGQIDSMATAMATAPAWLQARPDTTLHVVHGGTGYAVVPPASMTCAQAIEVISPSGASCGATTFTSRSAQCGVQTSGLSVGYDGTVVQLAPDPDPSHLEWFGPGTCWWHWWSGFFR